jgi:hypothetical protein
MNALSLGEKKKDRKNYRRSRNLKKMQKIREKMLEPLSKHGQRKRISLKKKLKVSDFKFIR